MILPAGVLTGVCIGSSLALGIVAELPDDSRIVQALFKNKKRAAIVSTAVSLSVGFFCGPVAGVISEMINYPASLYKVHKIKKYLEPEYKMPTNVLAETKTMITSSTNTNFIRTQFS